jgi:hypothetical protein
VNFICEPCRSAEQHTGFGAFNLIKKAHGQCRGRSWCDCQHNPWARCQRSALRTPSSIVIFGS